MSEGIKDVMSFKLTLDQDIVCQNFFAETALIGIASALQSHLFCWTVNRYFDYFFSRDLDSEICIPSTTAESFVYPVYKYDLPFANRSHTIYKLKDENESLMPEVKRLDYLWLVNSISSDTDAAEIVSHLKKINGIQLAQILEPNRLQSLANLVL
ncbi:MAG: IPExxxVDY family protein [Bacteroidetes bacterium]|nr:IPExxxVDY family protein [Bacteroidota bacterium]